MLSLAGIGIFELTVCAPRIPPVACAAPFPLREVLASVRAVAFYLMTFVIAVPLFTSMLFMAPFVLMLDRDRRRAMHFVNDVWANATSSLFYNIEVRGLIWATRLPGTGFPFEKGEWPTCCVKRPISRRHAARFPRSPAPRTSPLRARLLCTWPTTCRSSTSSRSSASGAPSSSCPR